MYTVTVRPQTKELIRLKDFCVQIINKVPIVWRVKLPGVYRLTILSDFDSCKAVQNTLVPGTDMQNVYALYVQSDKQTIYVRPFPKDKITEFLRQFHESICKVIIFQEHNTRILSKVGKHCSVEQMPKHFFSYVAYRNAQRALPKEIGYFNDIEDEIRF